MEKVREKITSALRRLVASPTRGRRELLTGGNGSPRFSWPLDPCLVPGLSPHGTPVWEPFWKLLTHSVGCHCDLTWGWGGLSMLSASSWIEPGLSLLPQASALDSGLSCWVDGPSWCQLGLQLGFMFYLCLLCHHHRWLIEMNRYVFIVLNNARRFPPYNLHVQQYIVIYRISSSQIHMESVEKAGCNRGGL